MLSGGITIAPRQGHQAPAASVHGTGRTVKFQQTYYVLDQEFRVLWVGGEWDEFALANGGAGARANEVLSTSLMRYIADEPTRIAMAKLVGVVIEMQQPLRLDYRCDSMTLMRRFQFTVQPMRDSRVLVVHDLRDAETFPEPMIQWHHDPEATDQKCSFCQAVLLGNGPWTPVMGLREPHPARVALCICPDCQGRIDEAVAALRGKRAPRRTLAGGFGPSVREE